MIKKISKYILSATLIVLLAACGNDAQNDTNTSANSSNSGTTEEVSIEFFNMKSEIEGIMNELVGKFEDENPGIKINHNVVPDPTQVLGSRVASGDTPEVFSDWPNAVWGERVAGGVLMDLSGDDYLENIQEEAREMVGSFTPVEGEYAVPLSYNTVGIVYNASLFDELSLEIPTTYDELINVIELIEAEGVAPFAMEGGDPGNMLQEWYVLLPSEENYDEFLEETISGDMTETSRKLLTNVTTKFLNLTNYSQPDPLGAGFEQARGDLSRGDAAMMLTGSWVFPVLRNEAPDTNFAMFPFPGEQEEFTRASAYPGDFSLNISANAKNPEGVKKFISFLTEEDNARFYAEETGAPSTIKEVDTVLSELEYQYDYILEGRMVVNPDSYWTSEINNLIGSSVQQLMSDRDVESFVETLMNAYSN